LRIEVIPKLWKINTNFKENIWNFMNYLENVKEFIDEEVVKFLEHWDTIQGRFPTSREWQTYFWLKDFKNLNLFLQKEIIRYIFNLRNNNSTIWLSESNINEIIRFINWKNNKTIKEIKMLKMKKDGDKVWY
jgi:hypothetical protein